MTQRFRIGPTLIVLLLGGGCSRSVALDDDVAGAPATGGSGGTTAPRPPTIRQGRPTPADGGVLPRDGSVLIERDAGVTFRRDAATDDALDAGQDELDEFPASCGDDGGTGVARIDLGATAVDGALAVEYVRRVERRRLAHLRPCYEELLERGCVQVLVMELHYGIAPDGHVQAASATTFPIGDATIQNCVTDAVLDWTFEPPDDGNAAEVSQRLRFVLTDA